MQLNVFYSHLNTFTVRKGNTSNVLEACVSIFGME